MDSQYCVSFVIVIVNKTSIQPHEIRTIQYGLQRTAHYVAKIQKKLKYKENFNNIFIKDSQN